MDVIPWDYEGRHYRVMAFSDVAERDGYGWELEDIGPAPAKGTLCEAFFDDATDRFTFSAFTSDPLPFELVRRFVTEASTGVPPTPS